MWEVAPRLTHRCGEHGADRGSMRDFMFPTNKVYGCMCLIILVMQVANIIVFDYYIILLVKQVAFAQQKTTRIN
jgi:hypothetical protein